MGTDTSRLDDLADAVVTADKDRRELRGKLGKNSATARVPLGRKSGESGRIPPLLWANDPFSPDEDEDATRRVLAGLADLDPVAYELRMPRVARTLEMHPKSVDRAVAAIRRQKGEVAGTVTAIDLTEFLSYEFPVREPILAPVLQRGSLNLLYAWRGIGKTHVALGIAYAAATGGKFFGWQAERPCRVLYVDGEMPGEAMQERVAAIVAATGQAPPPGYLRFLNIDVVGGSMPDLATRQGQAAIADECEQAELIVVDNLSCLVRGDGKENDAVSWLEVADWALALRSRGKCVLFIHHAGKNGDQRGTSKKEDLLDVSILLRRPADYTADQGARFLVEFRKARHLVGKDTEPFEAWLQWDENGRQVWTTQTVQESTYEQVLELAALSMSQTDIAKELDINKSTVCRHWARGVKEGRIAPKGK
jgi:hypothetical protein